MSIRISLYDFFAYMIPGVFYILIAAFGLQTFGVIDLDLMQLSGISLFMFIFLLGAGYVIGVLLDIFAYRWVRVIKGRNRLAREKAIAEFHQRYTWLMLETQPEEWTMLLQAVKIQTPDVFVDIEQQNAMSIMLRNISLGLLCVALIFVMTFVLVYAHFGNLIIAVIMLALSFMSLDRSAVRRQWFYLGLLEAFAAHYLVQEKTLDTKIKVKHVLPENPEPEINLDVDEEPVTKS